MLCKILRPGTMRSPVADRVVSLFLFDLLGFELLDALLQCRDVLRARTAVRDLAAGALQQP